MKISVDFDEKQIDEYVAKALSTKINKVVRDHIDITLSEAISTYISSKEVTRKIEKCIEENIQVVVVQYLGRRVNYLFDDLADKIIYQQPKYPYTVSDEELGFYKGLYAAWIAYSSQAISEKIMDSKEIQNDFIKRVYTNYIKSSAYTQLKRRIKAEMIKEI